MKKAYINPKIIVVKIPTVQLLAGSEKINMNGGQASEWGSRSYSFAEDDDEEEDF